MQSMLLFILLAMVGMTSCIFVVNDKKEKSDISYTDSSNAYAAKNDNLTTADSIIKIDSIKRDTIIKKFFLPSQIDTRNVPPQQVVEFAKPLIGIPYRYASTDPKKGFDCSGFITYVFTHFNIIVPRSSIDFTNVGRTIPADSAKPGDLILFTGTDSTEKFVGHMGLIVSNANKQINFIHSTSGKAYGVTITPFNGYYQSRYIKTIRIFPQND